MSAPVVCVVGQFDLFERDRLLRELVGVERRVRMDVDPGLERRVGLSGDQPRRTMIGVPVAPGVHRYDVHRDEVRRFWVERTEEIHAKGGKHPSAKAMKLKLKVKVKVRLKRRSKLKLKLR